jgi:hypothetical protein
MERPAQIAGAVVGHPQRHAPQAQRPVLLQLRREADARLLVTAAGGNERAMALPYQSVSRQTTNATNEEYVMNDFRLLINGRLVQGAGTLEVINPATGRTLTAAPRADRAQLEEAVAAAKAAFPTWSATPLRERGALLVELAEALEAEQNGFARLLTQEQGKPLPQALDEIAHSVATLRYFATLDLSPEVLKEDAAQKVVRQHKPLGVVAAITPWNLPLLRLMIKVAPALLAGNTVVAKPAPTTPLTTLKFLGGVSPSEDPSGTLPGGLFYLFVPCRSPVAENEILWQGRLGIMGVLAPVVAWRRAQKMKRSDPYHKFSTLPVWKSAVFSTPRRNSHCCQLRNGRAAKPTSKSSSLGCRARSLINVASPNAYTGQFHRS